MTITASGDVVDTIAADGDLWVGNTGTGSLSVNGGSIKSITAANTTAAGAEARLWVGRTSTGDGTVTISGAGSALEVVSSGRADAGATAQIGRGGTGSVSISAGGTLRVSDPAGTAYDQVAGVGNEAINVGRDTNGNGTLQVNAGHVVLSGTGAVVNVGRTGGIGVARFENGSTLDLSSTIAAGDVGLQIGRGGQGTVAVSDSAITLTSGGASATSNQDYGAYVQVGREAGGVGGLTLLNSTLAISGDSNLPGSPGAYAQLQIGRDGGNGAMSVTNSVVTLTNSPEGAAIFVGRSSVANATTSGSLLVSASTVTVDSTGFANFGIGRGTGAAGQATIGGGSTLLFEGDLGANLQVGTTYNVANSTGGTGTLTINNTGGTVTFQSDNVGTFAGANIGQFGGTGTVNIDGGTLRFVGAANAFMNIGYQYDSTQPGNVAANSAGTGSLILTNGAQFSMADGTGSSGLRLGNGVGNATMEIRSGSVANLDQGDATASTGIAVGSGVAGTGVATLLVSGAGSRLEGVGFVGVGWYGENNTTGGNGRLIVENGGRIVTANGFTVGDGGRLSGGSGTIEMQANRVGIVTEGGAIGDTGGAIQNLTIVGNLAVDYADARFDISSAGNDQVTVQSAGGVPGTSGVTSMIAADFDLNVLGGYHFTVGESRTFITSEAGIGVDFNEFVNSTTTLNGQHADFSYYLGLFGGGSSFGMTALNSGTTGGASTLDFGAASTLSAHFTYNATTGAARVDGGVIGAGGLTVGVDAVFGSSVGDTFNASQATQAMTFYGRGGNDILTGGSERDTAIYAAQRSAATITRNSDGTVTVSSAADGTDTLRSIERLQFADKSVALAVASHDFNGDGLGDLVWRRSDGQLNIWSSTGSNFAGADQGNIPTSWSVTGDGDFDGDGKTDLLWRNADGTFNLWTSNGAGFSGATFGVIPTGFKVKGTGDFDGDGKSDIVWQSDAGSLNVWTSTGTNFANKDYGSVGPDWKVQAVADFGGDGKADLLFRHTDGTLNVWTSTGTNFTSQSYGAIPNDWSVQDAADLNGDGKADILWRNADGTFNVWTSTESNFTSKSYGAVPTEWTIAGTSDTNGDSLADIIWRKDTGDLTVWTSTGDNFISNSFGAIGTEWQLML